MPDLIVPREESGDVFDALYRHWQKIRNPAKKQAIARILLDSQVYAWQIDQFKRDRARLRLHGQQKGNINGNAVTGELHTLERQACSMLCPAIDGGNGTAVREGWRWIMKQPWAKDFKAAPFEKRHYV